MDRELAPSPARRGGAAPSAEVLGLVAEAESAFATQQYDVALSFYDQALKLDPSNDRVRIGKELCAKALAEAPSVTVTRRTFVAGPTAYTPAGGKTEQSGPAGFAAGAGVAVRRVDQPQAASASIAFEVDPPEIRAGDTYTVRVYFVNEGASSIALSDATVATTIDGKTASGPLTLASREAAPRERGLVLSMTDRWRGGTSAWSLSVTVRTARGDVYRGNLSWK